MARPRQQRERAKDLTILTQDERHEIQWGSKLFRCDPPLSDRELVEAWRLHRASLLVEWDCPEPCFTAWAIANVPGFGKGADLDRKVLTRQWYDTLSE